VKDRKKEIMLEMYRPHIGESHWEEFKSEIDRVSKKAGPVTVIDTEYYAKNGEIKKIIFRFGDGEETYVLEPWRELACAGDWQKEHPDEYERLKSLLREAELTTPSAAFAAMPHRSLRPPERSKSVVRPFSVVEAQKKIKKI
jgi:hypothetical protein